nr:hypothetical protein Iba_chr03cCG9070 [Ipomoea batatas]
MYRDLREVLICIEMSLEGTGVTGCERASASSTISPLNAFALRSQNNTTGMSVYSLLNRGHIDSSAVAARPQPSSTVATRKAAAATAGQSTPQPAASTPPVTTQYQTKTAMASQIVASSSNMTVYVLWTIVSGFQLETRDQRVSSLPEMVVSDRKPDMVSEKVFLMVSYGGGPLEDEGGPWFVVIL